MNKACMKWKDQLLETALGQAVGGELEAHLSGCADCAAELSRLRVRRQRLDTLLPLVARAEEPSPGLRARIQAAAQVTAKPEPTGFWRWALVGAVTVVMIAVLIASVLKRPTIVPIADLDGARALAHWHAPTDVLLRAPGHEFLNTVPQLGDAYFAIPMKTEEGEK